MTHAVEDLTNADPAAVQEAARQRYREALDTATDLSAAELAAEFGMTDRWGRARRAEVKAEREAVARGAARNTVRNATRSASTPGTAIGSEAADQPQSVRNTDSSTRPDKAEPGTGLSHDARSGRNEAERPDLITALSTSASATDRSGENPPRFAQNRATESPAGPGRPVGPREAQALTEAHTIDRSGGSFDHSEMPAWSGAAEQVPNAVPATVPSGVPVSVPDRTVTESPEPAMPPADRSTDRGKAVAWLAFIVGITVSVAANVLHAKLPDPAAAVGTVGEVGDGIGQAGAAELLGAAFWPIALLLAIEVLTRVLWPAGAWWAIARFGGVGLVAAVAAIVSYRHMSGLLTSWGEDPLNAHIGPLAVDGLMLIAAAALLAIGRGDR